MTIIPLSLSHPRFGNLAAPTHEPNYKGSAKALDVLDHGYVAFRNAAGPTRRLDREYDASDVDPAQAARMSFDQMDSNRTEEEDHRLSRYLMKNWHTSPFEMVELWFEKKMPIFVARQFVRHRTAGINEVSARYVTLPEEWYIPAVVGGRAPNAKQGQEDNLPEDTQLWFKQRLDTDCSNSYADYLQAISVGVAPEHARMLLHLNHYTTWLWKQDLHNLMHFLSLRDHSHAQKEAQYYAIATAIHVRSVLPKSMELYDEYRRRDGNAEIIEHVKWLHERLDESYHHLEISFGLREEDKAEKAEADTRFNTILKRLS